MDDLFAALPVELCDIIMMLAHAINAPSALTLAITCKRERARYTRLVPFNEQLTWRQFVVDLAYDEGTVVWGYMGAEVVPGDKGYDKMREHDALESKHFHRELTKWQRRANAAATKKNKRKQQARLNKRDYDDEDMY